MKIKRPVRLILHYSHMSPQAVSAVVYNDCQHILFSGCGLQGVTKRKNQQNFAKPSLLQYLLNTYSMQELKLMQTEWESVHKVHPYVRWTSVWHFSTPPPSVVWDPLYLYVFRQRHHPPPMSLAWHLCFVAFQPDESRLLFRSFCWRVSVTAVCSRQRRVDFQLNADSEIQKQRGTYCMTAGCK